MSVSIPGGEFLTGSLDVISQSLTIPVLVILLIIVVISIITLGGIISEYTSRKKVPVGTVRDLIYKNIVIWVILQYISIHNNFFHDIIVKAIKK